MSARAPRVLDGHEVGVRAECLLRREPQHRRAERGEDARYGWTARLDPVGADERVVVHRVEVCRHARDRFLVAVSARIDLSRVADPETEQEAVVEGVREHARGVRSGDGIAAPDVRDAGGDADAIGGGQKDGPVREGLAVPEPLRVPERVVAEFLDLARRRPRLRRRLHAERTDPDADLTELHPPER
jgi:hypothetical protein